MLFIIITFIFILAVEVVHHLPGLEFLNETATLGNVTMWCIFAAALAIYAVATAISCQVAKKRFERVDM